MGVGQQNGVDALDVDWEGLPVALSQLLIALVEAAVDEYPPAGRAEQKAATRHSLGCTQKFQNRSASLSIHIDSQASA